MLPPVLHLNADLCEGFGDEPVLDVVVTSARVA
jgi:hypothetical protein